MDGLARADARFVFIIGARSASESAAGVEHRALGIVALIARSSPTVFNDRSPSIPPSHAFIFDFALVPRLIFSPRSIVYTPRGQQKKKKKERRCLIFFADLIVDRRYESRTIECAGRRGPVASTRSRTKESRDERSTSDPQTRETGRWGEVVRGCVDEQRRVDVGEIGIGAGS